MRSRRISRPAIVSGVVLINGIDIDTGELCCKRQIKLTTDVGSLIVTRNRLAITYSESPVRTV